MTLRTTPCISLILLSLTFTLTTATPLICSQQHPANDSTCSRLDNATFGLTVGIPVIFPFVFFFLIHWRDFLLPGTSNAVCGIGRRSEEAPGSGGAGGGAEAGGEGVELSERPTRSGYAAASTREDVGSSVSTGDTFQVFRKGGDKCLGCSDNFAEGALISFTGASSAKALHFTSLPGNVWRASTISQGWDLFNRGAGQKPELYLSVFGGEPSAGSLLVLTDRDHAGRFKLETVGGKTKLRVLGGTGAWYMEDSEGTYATVKRGGSEVTKRGVKKEGGRGGMLTARDVVGRQASI
ncbi:hypothetical protein TrCOL_g13357 [Triparma columacea]|uniref:Fascin domain-containing protein n=1 Tax=Triparma columacea TaxID=722753 RepID=A0A9W7GNL2_9STRA|nr:hypothetical protein TrCOL_g13357 [Triparma columacea]